MKNNISRQYIYLIIVSLALFIFVLIFSFAVLIPEGKEYRIKRVEYKKLKYEFREYENFHMEVLDTYKNLQGKNRAIISAFDALFNPQRFEKQNSKYFSSLSVSQMKFSEIQEEFALYEVNTTSEINSPKSFYNFLDAINKGDWIIDINFPIDFKREGELIKSSFKMKVYANKRDTNASASASEAK